MTMLKGWGRIARELGVHRCTAIRWWKRFDMPIVRVGRTPLIYTADLKTWLNERPDVWGTNGKLQMDEGGR